MMSGWSGCDASEHMRNKHRQELYRGHELMIAAEPWVESCPLVMDQPIVAVGKSLSQ